MIGSEKRERIEWLDVWIPAANEPSARRVLLVGDSITRSYWDGVNSALNGRAEVARLCTSRCVGDPALDVEISLVLGQARYDAIHFNNGLHGHGFTEEEYAEHLPRVVAAIRDAAPGSTIVLVTSTPVRTPAALDTVARFTDRVRERNRIVAELADAEDLRVDDLFAVVEHRSDWYSDDGVHLNDAGRAALADQVACCLTELLPSA